MEAGADNCLALVVTVRDVVTDLQTVLRQLQVISDAEDLAGFCIAISQSLINLFTFRPALSLFLFSLPCLPLPLQFLPRSVSAKLHFGTF